MTKPLSERIAERMAKKPPARADQNRATFIALRREIKASLEDGWPVKTIWETLKEEGKVTFSYQAFRGYVNRLILGKVSPAKPPLEQPEGKTAAVTAAVQKPASPSKSTAELGKIKGFVWNPNPSDEELFGTDD